MSNKILPDVQFQIQKHSKVRNEADGHRIHLASLEELCMEVVQGFLYSPSRALPRGRLESLKCGLIFREP